MADVNVNELKLNTRISLKYDLYTNWETNNPVLNKGEVALAYIPADATANFGNGVVAGTTPPNVVAKVGNGTSHYNDLKYLSALAADVPEWAKAVAKPEYSADEINGLADFINTEIQDTDTQYTLVKVNSYQYKLMSKNIGDESFTNEVGVVDIPKYDDTAVVQGIADNAAALAVLNGAGAGSVAKTVSDAITALNLASTYAPLVHTHTKSEITDFAHTHAISEVVDLPETLATLETKEDATAKLAEAKAHTDTEVGKVADALNTLENSIGYVATDDKTLVEKIDETFATKAELEAADGGATQAIADEAARAAAKEAELEGKITAEAERAAGVEAGLRTDVDAIAADYLKAADKSELVEALSEVAQGVTDEEARATAKEAELAGQITAEAERAAGIEAGLRTDVDAIKADYLTSEDMSELTESIGEVSQAVTDEAARAAAKEAEIEGKVTAEAERAAGIEAGLRTDVDAIAADYLKAADKSELAEDIAEVSQAVTDEAARAAAKEEELAGQITAEAERAAGVEAGLRTDIDAIAADYLKAADKTELEGKITEVATAVETEKARAEGIEAGLRTDIDAIAADYLKASDKEALAEAVAGTYATKADLEGAMTDASKAIADEAERAAAKEAELAGQITAEAERAAGVEAGLDTRVKAIEDDYLTAADKEALQTQINTIMNNPDTEGVINSINEFTKYLEEHGEIAEGFRTDIDKNKEDIAANAQAIADETTRATAAEEALGERIDELSTAHTEHTHSWDDLTDKPFYDEGIAPLTWDGVVSDDAVQFSVPETFILTKISDRVFTENELLGSNIIYNNPRTGTTTFTVDEEFLGRGEYGYSYGVLFVGPIVSGWRVPLVAVVDDNPEYIGTYFVRDTMSSGYTESITFPAGGIKTLDDKFISDNIARVTEVTALGEEVAATKTELEGKITDAQNAAAEDATAKANAAQAAAEATAAADATEKADAAQAAAIAAAAEDATTKADAAQAAAIAAAEQAVADEASRATAAEEALGGRIDDLAAEHAAHTHSWDALTDKPFYDEGGLAPITWDGVVVDGVASFRVPEAYLMYKVSDTVLTKNDIIGSTITGKFSGQDSSTIIDESVFTFNDSGDMIFVEVTNAYMPVIAIVNTAYEDSGIEVGTYFMTMVDFGDDVITALTFPAGGIKTLDDKFISANIARVSDMENLGTEVEETKTELEGKITDAQAAAEATAAADATAKADAAQAAAEATAKGYTDAEVAKVSEQVSALETWHENFVEITDDEIDALFA